MGDLRVGIDVSPLELTGAGTARYLTIAKKHFGRPGAAAYHAILVVHHLLRLAVLRFRGATASSSAPASAMALRVLLGRVAPPFRPVEPNSAADGSSRS